MSTTAAQFNAEVIREFRTHGGRVGGALDGTPLLLLHHTGAKSGASRVTPVAYLRDGARYAIFASNGGAPRDPAWVDNLRAEPLTSIEVGREIVDVAAAEAAGEERERLFALGAARFPQLAEYARNTERVIPVIALAPAVAAARPRFKPGLTCSLQADRGRARFGLCARRVAGAAWRAWRAMVAAER